MGFTMTEEAFMTWAQIESSWKQLKSEFALRLFRITGDGNDLFELIGAEVPRIQERVEPQPAALRPQDRMNRSEFSLHIGC
jgi:hypothetical protein